MRRPRRMPRWTQRLIGGGPADSPTEPANKGRGGEAMGRGQTTEQFRAKFEKFETASRSRVAYVIPGPRDARSKLSTIPSAGEGKAHATCRWCTATARAALLERSIACIWTGASVAGNRYGGSVSDRPKTCSAVAAAPRSPAQEWSLLRELLVSADR
jgi:hypothetical protein